MTHQTPSSHANRDTCSSVFTNMYLGTSLLLLGGTAITSAILLHREEKISDNMALYSFFSGASCLLYGAVSLFARFKLADQASSVPSRFSFHNPSIGSINGDPAPSKTANTSTALCCLSKGP